VLQAVAVAAKRNAFIDFFFNSFPRKSLGYHLGYVIVLIPNMVKLKDAMVIQPTVLALQSLLVLQKFLSILIDTFLGLTPGHA
jgi:hypothetical protein